MANIQTCPKTRLRTNEWLTLCITIKNEIQRADRDISLFKPEFDSFDACIIQFDNSLNRLSKSEYTKKSNELKRRLNASRNGLFKKITGDQSDSHADIAAAAVSLMIVVNQFKYMSQLSFEDIIGKTDSIIAYFKSDTYKDLIKLLGLEERVTQLQTINNEAKNILSKKATETGYRNMPRKTPVTRRELNAAYDKLVDQLNFLSRRDGDTDYLTLFAFWNALIDKARVSISLRSGASTGGKTDSGASNQPTSPPSGGGDDRPVIE
ncbi:DUF6261 family protein [Parabacteroides sp.]